MRRFMLKSKIHRATVTHADVDYDGSLSLDTNLLEAADIVPHEEVHVWNVTQGTRLQTYAIAAEPGSGIPMRSCHAGRRGQTTCRDWNRVRSVTRSAVSPSAK